LVPALPADFVCVFKDGSLGVFEAKGTTGTSGDITGALTSGKLQTANIGSQDGTGTSGPITMRAVVGAVLGEDYMRVIILDPPGERGGDGQRRTPHSALRTKLTADLVKKAAIDMRRKRKPVGAIHELPLRPDADERPATTETIFRAPGMEITLKYEDLRAEKRHGWLLLDKP